MATKKMSEMSVDSSLDGTERLLAQGADGSIIVLSTLSAYVIDQLVAATEVTPTTGDAVLMERSATEGTFDLDYLADYCVARGWSAASEADPTVSGDKVLIDRSGTVYWENVNTIRTYINADLQTTVLNISGLDDATPNSTDYMLFCEGFTAKEATVSEFETKLWADLVTHVTGLESDSTPGDSDELYMLSSGVAKKLTLTNLADYVSDEFIAGDNLTTDILDYMSTYLADLDAVTSITSSDVFYTTQSGTAKQVSMSQISNYVIAEAEILPWQQVDDDYYTDAPATTSTITMSNTSDFEVGYPVKYTIGATTYYGIVTAINANALLTIAGPSLSDDISALYVGRPERVVYKEFFIDTAAFAAVQDVLSTITYQRARWNLGPAYLVSFSATLGVVDTGASQPKINAKVAGSAVATGDGITLSGVAGTWTDNTAATIDSDKYDIARHDAIDIRCTSAGTNGDADCMSVTLVFVLE